MWLVVVVVPAPGPRIGINASNTFSPHSSSPVTTGFLFYTYSLTAVNEDANMVKIEVDFNPAPESTLKEKIKRSSTNNASPMHFSWHHVSPRLVLTSDSPDFDPTTVAHWKQEGFSAAYLPYEGDAKAYRNSLEHLADPLELGDKYAIVAYGEAAALCLEVCMRPMPKLCALVAYYPTRLPSASTAFPPSLLVQIHISSAQHFGTRHPSFTYPDTSPGFAEHDSDQFDKTGSRLAWSRALGLMRRGFGIDVDLEAVWENHTALEFSKKDAEATMKTMVDEPYVNHVPTMTGGIGAKDLKRFYAKYFIPSNPPDMKMKLLSRTVGTDRVVDELHVSYTHTNEIVWMLPGVPATGKRVDIIVVAVVCIRGGKIYHEHIHWDQASVLMQVGLIDPQLVPKTFKTIEKGAEKKVDELPVVGPEGAMKVADEEEGESNLFIHGW